MFSVAILDFVQITVITGGMLYIGSVLSGLAGGVEAVVTHAMAAGKLDFFPPARLESWIPFLGTWITMMFGSIPQQDVFQRITSAKDEGTAVRGSVLGGSLYFCFAFVPMFLAYCSTLVDPIQVAELMGRDSQLVLPAMIVQHTPLMAQIIFFGALLSAIMSCSSATLLAPSVAFSENIVRGFVPAIADRGLLLVMRIVVIGFAALVLLIAIHSEASIFRMVESAYKVTLVSAFVPLFAGLYWKKATTQGALLAIGTGLGTWAVLELTGWTEPVWPAQFVGFLVAAVALIVGSLLPQWLEHSAESDRGARRLP
ncbi:MAG TPA: sodium:solute symporter family protein, partial [Nitrospira sp.]|jgi:Na+/proline symporter|nr:sodium:solute symporter family protein [Nitrospira sp.]